MAVATERSEGVSSGAGSRGRRDRAKRGSQADAQHAYVTTPEQLHAAPGTIEVAHTVEPIILYTPRAGWKGTAYYASVGGALARIELTATVSRADAEAELRALERRYGPPSDRHTYAADAPAVAGTTRLVWVRGGVWLVAFAGDEGVSISYRRDDRPASAIAR